MPPAAVPSEAAEAFKAGEEHTLVSLVGYLRKVRHASQLAMRAQPSATHPGLPCARNTPPRIPTSPRCTAFNLAMTDQPSIPTLHLARQTAAGLKAELSSARDYSAVVQHTLAAELCAFESSLATGQVIGTAQAAPRDVPAPSTSMQMQSVDPRSLPTHDGSSGGDSRRPCLRANFSDWMITIGPEIFLRAVRGA